MKNSFIVKFIAIILFALFMTTLLLSGACIIFGFGTGAFVSSEKTKIDNKTRMLESLLYNYERQISSSYQGYLESHSSLVYDYGELGVPWFSDAILFEVRNEKHDVLYSSLDVSKDYLTIHCGWTIPVLKEEYIKENESSKLYENETYTVKIQYKDDAGIKDEIYYVGILYDFVSNYETNLYIVAAVSALAVVILFIIILRIAGHNVKNKDITITRFDKFPHDILTVIYVGVTALLCLGVFVICTEMESTYYNELFYDSLSLILVLLVGGIFLDFIFLAILLMTISVRYKTSTFIKSSIIYKLIILLGKLLRILWKYFVKIVRWLWNGFVKITKSVRNKFVKVCKSDWSLIRKIPLVWKTVIAIIVIMLVEFIILTLDWGYWWPATFIINGILGVGIIFVAILLKDIKNNTEDIANGNVYKKIDTKHLFLDLKDHAENINNMSDGIQKAVAEQMKSERFKTELITNVSHDIKTPLTSIINYVDLLEKEKIENETAIEYVNVLSRQSSRLKKLIDDLLEASKASTGNISVNLMEFELGILLSQALGEYEERFEKNNLQVVLNKTDETLYVMADNRHMWRVFDNILNNIAKYAHSGTRVYIDANRNGKNVEISFRNISKDPLNITGNELMERFVRGDSSRNTEGSGLGLSIAKSLAEVQNGKLDIQIDGDLFKVLLTFSLSE